MVTREQFFALVGASSAAQIVFFAAPVLLADVDPTYAALRAAHPDGPAIAVQAPLEVATRARKGIDTADLRSACLLPRVCLRWSAPLFSG
jgi:hypothetical protein